MIAPAILKTGIAIGVVGELATAAIAQTTGVDKTVIVGAALTFGGLLVTSVTGIVMQQTAARNALKAEEARALREEERETRETDRAEKTRELLEASAVQGKETHTAVNSNLEKQAQIVAGLHAEIKQLREIALLKAEMAPALGGQTQPPAPALPTAAPAAPAVTGDPIPVVIEGAKDPVPVDVIVRQEPPKEKGNA